MNIIILNEQNESCNYFQGIIKKQYTNTSEDIGNFHTLEYRGLYQYLFLFSDNDETFVKEVLAELQSVAGNLMKRAKDPYLQRGEFSFQIKMTDIIQSVQERKNKDAN